MASKGIAYANWHLIGGVQIEKRLI